MCKIMVITGLNPKNVENNWLFIENMGTIMTGRANNDGLGYTAVDTKGNIFGERWLNNEEAFDIRTPAEKVESRFLGFLEEEPEVVKYSSFGKRSDEIVAITLHTRFATSAKGILNTHPFVDSEADTSLIHNGVISNVMQSDHIRSTCDSERILNKYLEFNVNKNPAAMQAMVNSLRGNFACGIITRDASGKRVVDVFKSRAQLGGGIVRELDNAMVITTDKTDIKAVCKHLGMKVLSHHNAKEDLMIRFDAETGKALLSMKYTDTASSFQGSNSTAVGGNRVGRYNHSLQRFVYDDELPRDNVVNQSEMESRRAATASEQRRPADAPYSKEEMDTIYLNALKEVADKKEEVIKKVTNDLEQSKAIVASQVYDPLSENQAEKDGWFLERDMTWTKLDKKKVE